MVNIIITEILKLSDSHISEAQSLYGEEHWAFSFVVKGEKAAHLHCAKESNKRVSAEIKFLTSSDIILDSGA